MRISLSTSALLAVACLHASGQTCSNAPPANADQWPNQNPKKVYVDPKLPDAVKNAINQSVKDFADQTGEPVAAADPGSSMPPNTTQDVIRFVNDASAAPNSFARTNPTDQYVNGVNQNVIVSETIAFNMGYQLAPAQNGTPAQPAYDPAQPNAAQFLSDVVLHELTHAFGAGDLPVPNNPQTNQPDYSLQTRGGSIMNGYLGTNDQGHNWATSIQPCDKQVIQKKNPPPSPPASPGGGSGSGGGSGDGSGDITPSSPPSCGPGYSEWDDSTNTVTYYGGC